MRYTSTKQQGFTLLEVMIVIGLIGLVLATVSYTVFPSDKYDDVRREVKKLQVLFSLASDYAVLNQMELGLRIDEKEQTYEFVRLDENDNWVQMDNSEHFQLTEFSENIFISLSLDGLSWQQEDSLFDNRIFDEELSVRDAGVEIGEEDKKPPPPQIFIFSSGEITPFELNVTYQSEDINQQDIEFLLLGKDSIPLEFQEPDEDDL